MAAVFDISSFKTRLKKLNIQQKGWDTHLENFQAAWKQNDLPDIGKQAKEIRALITRQLGRVHDSVAKDLASLVNGQLKPSNRTQPRLRSAYYKSSELVMHCPKEAWCESTATLEKIPNNSGDKSIFKNVPSQEKEMMINTKVECITKVITLLKEEVIRNTFTTETNTDDDYAEISEAISSVNEIRNILQKRKSIINREHEDHEILIRGIIAIKHEMLQNKTNDIIENEKSLSAKSKRREKQKMDEHFDPFVFMEELKQMLKEQHQQITTKTSAMYEHGRILHEVQTLENDTVSRWKDLCTMIDGHMKVSVKYQHLPQNVDGSARLTTVNEQLMAQHEQIIRYTNKTTDENIERQKQLVSKEDKLKEMSLKHENMVQSMQSDFNKLQKNLKHIWKVLHQGIEPPPVEDGEQHNLNKVAIKIFYRAQTIVEQMKTKTAQTTKTASDENKSAKRRNESIDQIWNTLQSKHLDETSTSTESTTDNGDNTISKLKAINEAVENMQRERKKMFTQSQYAAVKQQLDGHVCSFNSLWVDLFSQEINTDTALLENVTKMSKEVHRLQKEIMTSENICRDAEHKTLQQKLDKWQDHLEKVWSSLQTDENIQAQSGKCPDNLDQLHKCVRLKVKTIQKQLKTSCPLSTLEDAQQQFNEYIRQLWTVLHGPYSFESSTSTDSEPPDSIDGLSKAVHNRATKLRKILEKSSRENVETEDLRKNVQDLKIQFKEAERERDKQFERTNHEKAKIHKHVKELQEKLEEAEREKEVLLTRISKVAGAKLTEGNANIADLSDPNRPQKLVEKYSELYDNEWTDAFGKLEARGYREEDALFLLLDIVYKAYTYCVDISYEQTNFLTIDLLQPASDKTKYSKKTKQLNTLHKKMITELRKQTSDESTVDIQLHFNLTFDGVNDCKKYINRCVELCWLMCIQSPPVFIDVDRHYLKFDKDCLRPYTKSGKQVRYLVWPPLYIEKGGGLLMKGVAQGK